jgi:hypothetical protein
MKSNDALIGNATMATWRKVHYQKEGITKFFKVLGIGCKTKYWLLSNVKMLNMFQKKLIDLKVCMVPIIHHKFIILQNFNKIHMKIIKQYVCATFVGFKV